MESRVSEMTAGKESMERQVAELEAERKQLQEESNRISEEIRTKVSGLMCKKSVYQILQELVSGCIVSSIGSD